MKLLSANHVCTNKKKEMSDITGLKRGKLLELLVMGPTFLSFVPSFLASTASEQAATWRVYQGFIDYYHGKTIMADLRYDFIDGQFYDHEAGAGAFQKVVDFMRQEEDEEKALVLQESEDELAME